jgi:hypothetical protein
MLAHAVHHIGIAILIVLSILAVLAAVSVVHEDVTPPRGQ